MVAVRLADPDGPGTPSEGHPGLRRATLELMRARGAELVSQSWQTIHRIDGLGSPASDPRLATASHQMAERSSSMVRLSRITLQAPAGVRARDPAGHTPDLPPPPGHAPPDPRRR